MILIRNVIALDDWYHILSPVLDSADTATERIIRRDIWETINERLSQGDHAWDEFLGESNWMFWIK